MKEAASQNMPPMSVTLDRSGESVALYAMLAAPRKAEAIDHLMSPHCPIDRSALVELPSRYIRVKSPDMETVWLPGVAYSWVWSPEAVVGGVPSPQSTV